MGCELQQILWHEPRATSFTPAYPAATKHAFFFWDVDAVERQGVGGAQYVVTSNKHAALFKSDLKFRIHALGR